MHSEPPDKLLSGEHVLVQSGEHHGQRATVLDEVTLQVVMDVLEKVGPALSDLRKKQKLEQGMDLYVVFLPNGQRDVLYRSLLVRTTTQEIVNAFRNEQESSAVLD